MKTRTRSRGFRRATVAGAFVAVAALAPSLMAQEGDQEGDERRARRNRGSQERGSRRGVRPGSDRRPGSGRRPGVGGPAAFIERMAPRLFAAFDKDGDKKLSKKELEAFLASADKDKDGSVGLEEFAAFLQSMMERSGGRPGAGGQSGEGDEDGKVSEETRKAARALREARERDSLPAKGEVAPDFLLSLLDGSSKPKHLAADAKGRVKLSSYAGKKPVVLIFGSYT